MNTERAIDKIRKLLAVANSSATGNGVEHEQETAMRQALSLLAKHNLTMKDIDEADEDKEERDEFSITEEFPCPWRRVVAAAIANLFFCEFFRTQVSGKQKYKFSFVGLESNATTAKEMTQYLIKSILRVSIQTQKDQNETVTFGTAFRNAAAARIAQRCAALRQEAEADPDTNAGNALVLANFYDSEKSANSDYITKILGVKLVTRKAGGNIAKDTNGMVQGYIYGGKVSLDKQIGR